MKKYILVILLALIVFPSFGQAQWVQTNGPTGRGIDVTNLVVSGPYLYAGTFKGGVFFSTDNGFDWEDANTGLEGPPVYATAVLGPNIFAGTYGGVYLSQDEGKSWSAAGTSLINTPITALIVRDTILFAGTGWSTVFRSSDNGLNWDSAGNHLSFSPYIVTSFAITGSNLFVGIGKPAGNPDATSGGGGVFRTTDNGNSWTEIDNGLTGADIQSLAVIGSNLFAGTYDNGVFRSTDSGNSWQAVNSGLPDTTHADALVVIDSDILVGTLNGVFISTNNGRSWANVNIGLTDLNIQSFAVDGTYLFAGTGLTGVWRIPLSDFGLSAVSPTPTTQNSLVSYPNPFSQSTTIAFASPENGAAQVSVVNILGAEVMRIFSGSLDAGEHSFSWDASTLPPGMYECVVSVNGNVQRIPLSHLR